MVTHHLFALLAESSRADIGWHGASLAEDLLEHSATWPGFQTVLEGPVEIFRVRFLSTSDHVDYPFDGVLCLIQVFLSWVFLFTLTPIRNDDAPSNTNKIRDVFIALLQFFRTVQKQLVLYNIPYILSPSDLLVLRSAIYPH